MTLNNPYRVIWSVTANRSYDAVVGNILEYSSAGEAAFFISRVDEVVRNLAQNPFIYEASQKKRHYRRCVVTKKVSLFYRIDRKNVVLTRFFDTRQDPGKLRL